MVSLATLWHQLSQQRLKGWQLVLLPIWAISAYLVVGVTFLGLGFLLLDTSWSIVEHRIDYTDALHLDPVARTGVVDVDITRDMAPPIWVYYELDGFYQNLRDYVQSRDEVQLRGDVVLDPKHLKACEPLARSADGRPSYPCGLVAGSVFNDTFALQAMSRAPTDVGHLADGLPWRRAWLGGAAPGPHGAAPWQRLDVDSSADAIAWPADLEGRFRNVDPEALTPSGEMSLQVAQDMWILRLFPPVVCEQVSLSPERPFAPVSVATRSEWYPGDEVIGSPAREVEVVGCSGYNAGGSSVPTCRFERQGEPFACEGDYEERRRDWGVESGHFIVWMRVAALDRFQKLWGKINQPLRAGSKVRLHFQDNFPVKAFGGRKTVILSTSSELGGRNDLLGWGYVAAGIGCLALGARRFMKRRADRLRAVA